MTDSGLLENQTELPPHNIGIARGGVTALVINSGSAGLGFVLQLVLARTMGLSEYGVYALAFAWIQVLALVGRFGCDSVLLRYGSTCISGGQWPQFKRLLRDTSTFVLGMGGLLASCTCVVAFLAIDHTHSSLRSTFFVLAWVLPLWTLTGVRQAAVQAMKHVARSQAGEKVLRPLLMLLLVTAIGVASNRPLTSRMVAALLVLSSLGALIFVSTFLRRLLPGCPPAENTEGGAREWVTYAIPVLVLAALLILIRNTGVLVIGALVGPEHAGILSTVFQIADLMLFGLTAVNVIAPPYFAQYYAQKDMHALQHAATLTARMGFGFALLCGIVLWVMGPWILGLFGMGFVAGTPALRILLVGQVANAGCGLVGMLMIMTGDQVAAMWVLVVAAAAQILLSFILVPAYGMVGAAAACVIGYACWNVGLLWRVRKRLGVDAGIFSVSGGWWRR